MNILRSLLSLVLSLVLMTGCAPAHMDMPDAPQPTVPAVPVELADVPVPVPRPDNDETVITMVCPDVNPATLGEFGMKMLKTTRKEGENSLLSPLSAALALGMTMNGTQGETDREFQALFGMPAEVMNSYASELLRDYGDLGGSTQTVLANSLWADPSLELEDSFVCECMDFYHAQLYQQDLQDPATPAAVNRWVSDATRGLIPTVVDQFDGDAVLALINAVYLKNKFVRPFKPSTGWTMNFTAQNGTVYQPEGMSNGTRTEEYVKTKNAQGVVLPYDDDRLGLLLILPDEGTTLSDLVGALDGETLRELICSRQDARVGLVVPKFKTEWSGELKDTLSTMGLKTAFDPNKADFTGMGHAKNDPGRNLYIGSVIHKTAFELNEEGTEAAAVTAVIMEVASAMPPDDVIYLTFDRPFLYAIVDLENGIPLFLGTQERF